MELYKILDSEKKTWKDVVDGESRPYTYKLTTPDTKAANLCRQHAEGQGCH